MKGREAYDDTVELALDLEKAVVEEEELSIFLLDNSKFFDNFAWQTLFPLALRLGLLLNLYPWPSLSASKLPDTFAYLTHMALHSIQQMASDKVAPCR